MAAPAGRTPLPCPPPPPECPPAPTTMAAPTMLSDGRERGEGQTATTTAGVRIFAEVHKAPGPVTSRCVLGVTTAAYYRNHLANHALALSAQSRCPRMCSSLKRDSGFRSPTRLSHNHNPGTPCRRPGRLSFPRDRRRDLRMPDPETVKAFLSGARIFSGSAKYSSLGISFFTSADQET